MTRSNNEAIPEEWLGDNSPIDFIVVGAGAAGCPLAARLAERGYYVVVIDMGPKHADLAATQVTDPIQVPLLHPEATEDPRFALKYFVNQRDADPNQPPATQVFYPRGQGVGGCTNHNAMITLCGPNEDWDEIAEMVGDPSWNAMTMRAYFERIEDCDYAKPRTTWERWKAKLFGRTGWEGCRHGTSGWLTTTLPDMHFLKEDKAMLGVVLKAATTSMRIGVDQLSSWLKFSASGRVRALMDPNHWNNMERQRAGVTQIPCAIDRRGQRSSPRQRLLDAETKCNGRLHVLSHVLVTQVEMAGDRAIGVRTIAKAHVYKADPNHQASDQAIDAPSFVIRCSGEVILSAGAFNTPQLLMLSGIGDQELSAVKISHPLRGVGRNLQDRYEVSIQATLKKPFQSLRGINLTSNTQYAAGDSALQNYLRVIAASGPTGSPAGQSPGIYSSNGALVGLLFRSDQQDEISDIFIMALAGQFSGYREKWSEPASLIPGFGTLAPGAQAEHRTVSWLVLKARTKNCAGFIRLVSSNPTDTPEINFRSFAECESGDAASDLKAMEQGVEFVECILKEGVDKGEVESVRFPGRTGNDQPIQDWIRQTAWGHHACGTCKLGREDDPLAVVNSRFQVRGIKNLRIVDASIFPRIPGYFIVTNIYMIAEKAADVLTEDHPRTDEQSEAGRDADATAPVIPSTSAYRERRVFPSQFEADEAALVRDRRKAAGR